MRVFVSGMMGTGKSTVGRLLAESLGAAFVDLDGALEARLGKSVSEFFASEGEERFRVAEAELARELCSSTANVVVALGGGTVVRDATRRRLLDSGLLITLVCDVEELARRLSQDASRPLLQGGDPAARLAMLEEERRAAYAECHALVDASSSPHEVAALAALRIAEAPLAVALGTRSYRIEVGRGAIERLPKTAGARLEVADENTARYARAPFLLNAGEANKNVEAVASIWDEAIERGLDRRCEFVGVGGGVVGDLTGFAAASYLRGVRFGLVATSVVAMVDSSVGGKTGFNRSGGKNLVGAFHQPSFVVCDIDMLRTLDEEEYRSGMAEVVKSLWLDGEGAVEDLESAAEGLNERDPKAIEMAVRRSISLKARIVAADEREKGQRMLLNLGHTLGHGFEAAAGFGGLRHGDAVSLGMAAACDVSLAQGALSLESAGRLRKLLTKLRLPIDYEARVDEQALAFVGRDKKRAGENIRFVLPKDPGDTQFLDVRPRELPGLLQRGAEVRSGKLAQ